MWEQNFWVMYNSNTIKFYLKPAAHRPIANTFTMAYPDTYVLNPIHEDINE